MENGGKRKRAALSLKAAKRPNLDYGRKREENKPSFEVASGEGAFSLNGGGTSIKHTDEFHGKALSDTRMKLLNLMPAFPDWKSMKAFPLNPLMVSLTDQTRHSTCEKNVMKESNSESNLTEHFESKSYTDFPKPKGIYFYQRMAKALTACEESKVDFIESNFSKPLESSLGLEEVDEEDMAQQETGRRLCVGEVDFEESKDVKLSSSDALQSSLYSGDVEVRMARPLTGRGSPPGKLEFPNFPGDKKAVKPLSVSQGRSTRIPEDIEGLNSHVSTDESRKKSVNIGSDCDEIVHVNDTFQSSDDLFDDGDDFNELLVSPFNDDDVSIGKSQSCGMKNKKGLSKEKLKKVNQWKDSRSGFENDLQEVVVRSFQYGHDKGDSSALKDHNGLRRVKDVKRDQGSLVNMKGITGMKGWQKDKKEKYISHDDFDAATSYGHGAQDKRKGDFNVLKGNIGPGRMNQQLMKVKQNYSVDVDGDDIDNVDEVITTTFTNNGLNPSEGYFSPQKINEESSWVRLLGIKMDETNSHDIDDDNALDEVLASTFTDDGKYMSEVCSDASLVSTRPSLAMLGREQTKRSDSDDMVDDDELERVIAESFPDGLKIANKVSCGLPKVNQDEGMVRYGGMKTNNTVKNGYDGDNDLDEFLASTFDHNLKYKRRNSCGTSWDSWRRRGMEMPDNKNSSTDWDCAADDDDIDQLIASSFIDDPQDTWGGNSGTLKNSAGHDVRNSSKRCIIESNEHYGNDVDDDDLVAYCDQVVSPTIPTRKKMRILVPKTVENDASKGVKGRLKVLESQSKFRLTNDADTFDAGKETPSKDPMQQCPICMKNFNAGFSKREIDQHMADCFGNDDMTYDEKFW